ncbi:MAG: helix-turn-helix domain-containing protein [Bacteroidales bacterium]|jgi:AraC-like DNA-binding protein|nr:helix-turn-helix domain-containing protein [Bacteroidales bacterium]
MKYTVLFLVLSFSMCVARGQGQFVGTAPDSVVIERYKDLSAQQILDTSKIFYRENNLDEALACLNLLMERAPQYTDIEHQKIGIQTYYCAAIIHYYMDNLRLAYELSLKALQLSEAIEETKDRPGIYVVIGNIYSQLHQPDLAKRYFNEAMNIRQDSSFMALVLNNIGSACVDGGELDSAYLFLKQSIDIAGRHRPSLIGTIQNSLALLYKEKKMYDSAFYYYRLSLAEAQRVGDDYAVSATFSDLGKLFLDLRRPDSAVYYTNLSNAIAIKYDFKTFLMENYLTLSKVAESRGQSAVAFAHFKKYADLERSSRSHKQVAGINQIQRLYEVAKTNQHIEQLTIAHRIKQQTVRYQYVILTIIVLVLAFVIAWNRKLNRAYRKLFEKNVEIVELQKNCPETPSVKYQNSHLSNEQQSELLARIYVLMEDTAVICAPDFSVEKMAEMLQSNRMYISQVINETLNKNFRSFINDYRIREAQRLFSESDASKFTVEAVSLKTGYKSRTSFISAFKEITGVSPSFYLKSMVKG